MPEWYPLMRAARYLNVPPWELMNQSQVWMDWALAAEAAEIEAHNIKIRKAGSEA